MRENIIKHMRICWHLSSLTNGIIGKINIYACYVWMYSIHKIHVPEFIPWKLVLKKFNTPFIYYVYNIYDLTVLAEIFLQNEYEIYLSKNPEVIFDLGSNSGLSVIYFHLKYPQAHIYAFEPHPLAFKRLKRNTNQFTKIHIYNLGIADKSTISHFFSYRDSILSSSVHERNDKTVQPDIIHVHMKTLDAILTDLAISFVDLLKFDIEGAEYEVFKECTQLHKVKNMIGEVHTDLFAESNEEFLKLFDPYEISIQPYKRSDRYLIQMKRIN